MRRAIAPLFLMLILVSACETEKDLADRLLRSSIKLTDGYCLVAGDQVVLNHYDIAYYDYGVHLIYLKSHMSSELMLEEAESLTVYAGGEEIYTVPTQPGYSSYMPQGPIIWTFPTFFEDNIIAISLIRSYEAISGGAADSREDPRIVKALEKYGQYREGLQCEIVSIQFSSPDDLVLILELTNKDPENYYYLDPEKMGMGLYHYFTNGVILWDKEAEQTYTHQVDYIEPFPWDSWDLEWMSLLESNSSVTLAIEYDHFELVPPGTYLARFRFPGLGYQVERDQLAQRHGQIWLGELQLNKEVVVE